MPDGAATAHILRPKLITILSEGYGFGAFRHDFVAAVTVAIVALPLSMAIAVAAGVSPDRGLFTALSAGFSFRRSVAAAFRLAGRLARSLR